MHSVPPCYGGQRTTHSASSSCLSSSCLLLSFCVGVLLIALPVSDASPSPSLRQDDGTGVSHSFPPLLCVCVCVCILHCHLSLVVCSFGYSPAMHVWSETFSLGSHVHSSVVGSRDTACFRVSVHLITHDLSLSSSVTLSFTHALSSHARTCTRIPIHTLRSHGIPSHSLRFVAGSSHFRMCCCACVCFSSSSCCSDWM
jgi:hypothetical protein